MAVETRQWVRYSIECSRLQTRVWVDEDHVVTDDYVLHHVRVGSFRRGKSDVRSGDVIELVAETIETWGDPDAPILPFEPQWHTDIKRRSVLERRKFVRSKGEDSLVDVL